MGYHAGMPLQQSPMYAYLPARDVARARAFYEQNLGFTPAEEIAGGARRDVRGIRHARDEATSRQRPAEASHG